MGGAYHLGSLNNILLLTRQRRVSPDQSISRNTSRDTRGRNLTTAALTVGRVSLAGVASLFIVISVGRVLLHLTTSNLM
jgi:hypothetical protein